MLDRVGRDQDMAHAAAGDLPVSCERLSFAAAATDILKDIDLVLSGRAPTVLMGPNGSGKSTLLKLAMGLMTPSAGRITFGGAEHPAPGLRALVFQKPVMLRRTVADNVAFALASAGQQRTRDDIARLLEVASIAHLADRPARRLSGGEQQRLALARALARRPRILLLDEPTASLDPSATRLVEEIIARVAADGVKIIMATHDRGQALRLAGDVVFLAHGRLAEHSPAATFFTAPASEAARRFLAGELVI